MKRILLLTSLLFTTILFAQTGPGGVGKTDGTSNLNMWYDPSDLNTLTISGGKVTGLTNKAGFSVLDLTATTAAPVLNVAVQNSYNEMNFEAGDDLLNSGQGLSASNFVSNAVTAFAVTNPNTNHNHFLYGASNTAAGNRFLAHIPWSDGTVYFDLGNAYSSSGRISQGGLSNILNYNIWGTKADGTSKHLYQNSKQENVINAGAGTFTSYSNTEFLLGKNYQGQITEIIIFKEKINEAKRKIIDNYLSAKYNITLSTNNFYTQDDNANGDFDHNVAGIGQATDSSNHTDSQGTGVVRINTPSALDNEDYLFWGENVKDATYEFATSTEYTERLNTTWRVSKQNDLGTVTLSVKDTDIDLAGKNSCAPLKLILSSNADFSSKTSYDMTLSSGIYTATNVNFTDGDYFTFEYIDKIVVDDTKFYNGSGVSNVPNTFDGCYKLLVRDTADGTLPLTEDAVVREIEVETNGILIVNDALKLEVLEAIQLDGTIRLNGQSQLLQTHTGVSTNTGTGHLLKDRNGAKNAYRYNYWSSPVQNDTGGVFSLDTVLKDGTTPNQLTPTQVSFTTSPDGTFSPFEISTYWTYKYINGNVDPYNEEGWIAIDETGTVNPGEGYTMKGIDTSAAATATQNYSFEGKPNDGDYSLSILNNKEYLVGNPYPSALDADQFLSDNSSAIDGTIWFWDHWSANTHVYTDYGGGYIVYTPGSGATSASLHPDFVGGAHDGTSGSISLPTNYKIPVGQGFIVRSVSTSGGTITFKNSQRTFQPEAASSIVVKSETPEDTTSRIRIGYEGPDERHRFLLLALTEGGTNNYESGFDAEMIDLAENDMYFTMEDAGRNLPYVIQGVGPYQFDASYPFIIRAFTPGEHRIMIDGLENFEHNVYVLDKKTNTSHLINDGEFVVNLEYGEHVDRFEIAFFDIANLGNTNYTNTSIGVHCTNTILTVFNPKNEIITNLQVFSSFGQLVCQKNNLKSEQQIILPFNFAKGAYILKVETNKGTSVVKFLN